MKTVTFGDKTVISVSSVGLRYLDNDGCNCFVDFDECHANYRRTERTQSHDRSDSLRCVGFRDSSAELSYMEFLTEPVTRFEFLKPPSPVFPPGTKFVPRRVAQGYLEFITQLTKAGVTTGDFG